MQVEENVETVSQEKPESSEEVVKTQETTEQSMETEPKEEPQPASQTEETPPSPKPSSPPAIVVTEAKSPMEEARSPRSSISPSPSGGRVTRRSGSKRREAGLARETPQREGQREGSAQETEEQQQRKVHLVTKGIDYSLGPQLWSGVFKSTMKHKTYY